MPPSANWLALKKNLKGGAARPDNERPKKRRKVGTLSEGVSEGSIIGAEPEKESVPSRLLDASANRDSVTSLRNMVYGQLTYPPAHLLPGKYLAIDCEMVGIAGDSSREGLRNQGDESSLARVSVVNYHGAVQLDVFVRQRERVTDWRTTVSGVRESDMVNAKSFSEVQKLVADLLKDRILVGHAVHNDLKALLLSHPHNMTRDTQVLAGRHGTLATSKPHIAAPASSTAVVEVKVNRKPALRKLVSQELGIEIQAGEHSSVIDARATMAIYRMHRKTWDQGFLPAACTTGRKPLKHQIDDIPDATQKGITVKGSSMSGKRSLGDIVSASDNEADDLPGRSTGTSSHARHPMRGDAPAKRQGISSGLSVVVKKRNSGTEVKQIITGTRGAGKSGGKDAKWWGTLSN